MINFNNVQKIYFIGIGGIMVSAVARYFIMLGKDITGSDRNPNEFIDKFIVDGIKIHIGHNANNLGNDTDLVIYTQAISINNPELQKAKKLNIPTITVYEALGIISQNKKTIAVTGMHGKSTTTGMLSSILNNSAIKPTVFVGTKIKEWQSNFHFGRGEYILSEACEYKDNFLNYSPYILVINNIEPEHLDYFKNLKNIKKSFAKLVKQSDPAGALIINADDKNISDVIKKYPGKIYSFGIDHKANFQAIDVAYSKNKTIYTLKSTNRNYNNQKIELSVNGQHNVYNSLATLATCASLNIESVQAVKYLKKFKGAWRRFEFKGKKNGIEIYDDYGHHPTEIKTTLETIRDKFGNKRVWIVFQPHLYSRTKLLFTDFINTFKNVDNLIITDIYAAREKNEWGISSKDLIAKINNKKTTNQAQYISSFKEVTKYLKKNIKPGDIIFTLGAGEAYKIGDDFLK